MTAATKFPRGSLSLESNAAAVFSAVSLLQSFGVYSAAVEMLYYQAIIKIGASSLVPIPLEKYATVEQWRMVILFLKNVLQEAILKHNLVLASLPSPKHHLSQNLPVIVKLVPFN